MTTFKVLNLNWSNSLWGGSVGGGRVLAPSIETDGQPWWCPRGWGGLQDTCYFGSKTLLKQYFRGHARGKKTFVQIWGQWCFSKISAAKDHFELHPRPELFLTLSNHPSHWFWSSSLCWRFGSWSKGFWEPSLYSVACRAPSINLLESLTFGRKVFVLLCFLKDFMVELENISYCEEKAWL